MLLKYIGYTLIGITVQIQSLNLEPISTLFYNTQDSAQTEQFAKQMYHTTYTLISDSVGTSLSDLRHTFKNSQEVQKIFECAAQNGIKRYPLLKRAYAMAQDCENATDPACNQTLLLLESSLKEYPAHWIERYGAGACIVAAGFSIYFLLSRANQAKAIVQPIDPIKPQPNFHVEELDDRDIEVSQPGDIKVKVLAPAEEAYNPKTIINEIKKLHTTSSNPIPAAIANHTQKTRVPYVLGKTNPKLNNISEKLQTKKKQKTSPL